MTMKHLLLLFGVATLGVDELPRAGWCCEPGFRMFARLRAIQSGQACGVKRLLPEGNPLDHVDRRGLRIRSPIAKLT
jgi:hypothetical protein